MHSANPTKKYSPAISCTISTKPAPLRAINIGGKATNTAINAARYGWIAVLLVTMWHAGIKAIIKMPNGDIEK